jgi:hypothetical protein
VPTGSDSEQLRERWSFGRCWHGEDAGHQGHQGSDDDRSSVTPEEFEEFTVGELKVLLVENLTH